MGASKGKEGVEWERKHDGCVWAVQDEQTARGGAGMEEIAEVRGKLSQNCIHCACTISRSRRERMREGERELREAGKVPDFSCRSGKIDLEDEIGDKGISKGNGFSPLFFTSQES